MLSFFGFIVIALFASLLVIVLNDHDGPRFR